jgi:hypothetical protein
MGPLLCSRGFRFFLIVVWLSFADVALAQNQSPPPDAGQSLPGTYPYNQPWGSSKTKNSKAKAQQAPAYQEAPKSEPASPASQPAPVAASAASAAATAPADMSIPATPSLKAPKVAKNEVSVSGDFLYGTGTVTVPLGYSVAKTLTLGNLASIQPTATSVSRNSDYLGGTISYSYLHAWFIDLSYEHGTSSGNVPIKAGFLGDVNSSFTINDEWYQAYLRYAFPALRGKRLSAYLRAGASFVKADLNVNAQDVYRQTDSTTDILGNAGFGVGYSLYASRRFILSLQVEGEGFVGERSQKSKEILSADAGLTPVGASINNNLYGGIGRGTIHFEYRLGQANRFRVFADAGAQAKFTEITYPSGAGTFNELLWGPYAKLGLRYSF